MMYTANLDPDVQVTAEEDIAARIFHRCQCAGELSEEDCQELGKQILLAVLQEFRPDMTREREEVE
jgi:hypothetical protein